MNDEEVEYYTLVQKVFKILAPVYDILVMPLSRVRRRVAGMVAARRQTILDVATGTGKQAMAFAENGHDVIGVDLSFDMLRVAKKKNKRSNLTFEHGDATHLRFGDNSFDVSSVSFALHDMPLTIRERVLQEMVRVTKASGSILIVDYALPKSKAGRSLVYHLVSSYEGKYYRQFINSDLELLLGKVGIEICEHKDILSGAAQIILGVKTKRETK